MYVSATKAKPFLKWAGGKGQLIPAIHTALPRMVYHNSDLIYVEPFIGSGAVMFWFLQQFPQVKSAVICDINTDLINTYAIIKSEPENLIKILSDFHEAYYACRSSEQRLALYMEKRDAYNFLQMDTLTRTAHFIFLNKTCFNGLYRVNSQNIFNVPFGRYLKPNICDARKILANHKVLKRVTVLEGDYEETLAFANENSFFYLDPPYKPISKTASFNAYANSVFDDKEQIRLRDFCTNLTTAKAQWLLSNSDPKNTDPSDNFFDELFSQEQMYVERVKAKRAINSVPSKRGEIFEILVSNYEK